MTNMLLSFGCRSRPIAGTATGWQALRRRASGFQRRLPCAINLCLPGGSRAGEFQGGYKMMNRINRRAFLGTTAIGLGALALWASGARAQDKVKLRLSSPATPTDQRAISLTEIFAPAISGFAEFEPHWNATLFKQGTELEAISRGNLEMAIGRRSFPPSIPSGRSSRPATCTAMPSTRRRCSRPIS
jgi:hypothetical protein